MKKTLKFTGLAVILLLVFACDFQIPSTVEVKGNLDLPFVANMDIVEVFQEAFNGAIDSFKTNENGVNVLDAVDATEKTFVVSMPLPLPEGGMVEIPEIPGLGEASTITIGGITINIPAIDEITIPNDIELATFEDIDLPLGNFEIPLEGFKFDISEIEAGIYFGGSQLVETLEMEMKVGSKTVTNDDNDIVMRSSGITADMETFEGTSLSPFSLSMTETVKEILDSPVNTTIGMKITLPAGSVITREMLNTARDNSISAELAIWLPIKLKADTGGAEIEVEQLDIVGDFISQLAETEFVENLNVEMKFNKENHPFSNGALIIRDTNDSDFEIKTESEGLAINLNIGKDDIDHINNSGNFSPKISVFFEGGAELAIPSELKLTTVKVNAEASAVVIGGDDEEENE